MNVLNECTINVNVIYSLIEVEVWVNLAGYSSKVMHSSQIWFRFLKRLFYSFSRLLTHIFWKHASFSPNSKHKSQNHSHKMQNPLYLLQNATLFSKQWYVTSKGYFVFKWQTQLIIWVDVLSIDWTLMCSMENTSMKALSGALCLFMFSVTVRLLL